MSWKSKCHDDLVREGYIWKGYGTCREPSCRKVILFYRTPNGKIMPIDQKTFEPHFATCAAVLRKRREKAADEEFLRSLHIAP